MTNIDPQRRQQLLAKFPAMTNPPMPPMANTQVCAINRAENIVRKVWGDGGLGLADELLAATPAMRARAEAAASEFHRRLDADGLLRYDTFDTDYDRDALYEHGVAKLWRVGSDTVDIVRDRWHNAPTRKPTTVEFFAGLVDHSTTAHDYWECRCEQDCVCDLRCNVNVASDCGGATRLLPVGRGVLVLLFRCCWTCETELAAALPAHRPGTPGGA